MEKQEMEAVLAGEVITIGAVKAPVKVWGYINTYKTKQRELGRKINMPDALIELAAIGAKSEGILPTIE